LLIYGGLLAGGRWGSEWLLGLTGVSLGPGAETHARHVVIAGVVLYAALMAVPFVPGMEISIALLTAFGSKVAVLLYAATVGALTASYLIGRLVPMTAIAAFFASFGQRRAETLVRSLEPMNAGERLEALISHAPKRIVPALLRHRYIAVIIALNIPGNAIIGGGGGIALAAGISGLFTFPRYLLAVAVAVLPVPLFILLTGT